MAKQQQELLAPEHANGLATVQAEPSIAAILAAAVEKGQDVTKLVELYERLDNRRAERDFTDAMARFKAICPAIPRRTINSQFKVKRATHDGRVVEMDRRYAALDDIEETIRKPMAECGLSFRWEDTRVENGVLSMKCVIAHTGGHSKASSVVLPVESRAGCSEQQKYGSAMTYAQRYSLIQALGLTTCDEDDDGNGGGPQDADEKITTQQAADLEIAIEEAKGDREKFLKFFGIEKLADLPASRLQQASRMIEAKRRANK